MFRASAVAAPAAGNANGRTWHAQAFPLGRLPGESISPPSVPFSKQRRRAHCSRIRLAIVQVPCRNALIVEIFFQSSCVEVAMSISDRAFDAAFALHKRIVFIECQMAELGVLRNRLAQAQLRSSRSRSSRSPSKKLDRRRRCR